VVLSLIDVFLDSYKGHIRLFFGLYGLCLTAIKAPVPVFPKVWELLGTYELLIYRMHSFIPVPLTRIPCLVDILPSPLIGVGEEDTFVVQTAYRGNDVTSPNVTAQRPIASKL